MKCMGASSRSINAIPMDGTCASLNQVSRNRRPNEFPSANLCGVAGVARAAARFCKKQNSPYIPIHQRRRIMARVLRCSRFERFYWMSFVSMYQSVPFLLPGPSISTQTW